jgi:hypothetical protein
LKNIFILFLFLYSYPAIIFAQKKDKPNEMEIYQRDVQKNRTGFNNSVEKEFGGLIAGFQRGNYSTFEIGYGYGYSSDKLFFGGMGPSAEFNLKDKVTGYKLGIWFNALLSFGINTVLYHNYNRQSEYFNKLSFGIRPDIGFGFSVFNFTYGYNFLVTNAQAEGINKHLFSMRCMIPIVRKK